MERTQTHHVSWFALQRLQGEPNTEVAGAISSRFGNSDFVLASQPQKLLPFFRRIRLAARLGVSGAQGKMNLGLPGSQPHRRLQLMRPPRYIQVSFRQNLPQE